MPSLDENVDSSAYCLLQNKRHTYSFSYLLKSTLSFELNATCILGKILAER